MASRFIHKMFEDPTSLKIRRTSFDGKSYFAKASQGEQIYPLRYEQS